MELTTASGIINFVEALEDTSAKFYESAAQRHGPLTDIFISFAKENKKNVQAVKRAYYSVISDALEACFSFGTLLTTSYEINVGLDDVVTRNELLQRAIDIENTIHAFYKKGGESVASHIEDIARIFKRLARTHENRVSKLRDLKG